MNLKPKASKIVNLKFSYPSNLTASTFQVGVWVDPSNAIGEINTSNKTVSGSPLLILPPTASLKASFVGKLPTTITRGHSVALPLSITNLGNTALTGNLGVNVFELADPDFDGANVLLSQANNLRLSLQPGKQTRIRVRINASSGLFTGQGYLAAVVSASGSAGAATSTVVSQVPVTFR